MKENHEVIPYGHMVHEANVSAVRALSETRSERRAAGKTRAQAEALVRDVRRRVRRCFGTFPERNPPRSRVTGILERDGYRVEKVMFDSRPNFPVTANLYLPTGVTGRVPGVIGACGHSAAGKTEGNYQAFCQGLVRKGLAVLVYDPLGQGERLQLADLSYPGFVSGPCHEHNMLGNVMQLCGDFLGTWRAWDGIRALDYLLTRPEIDPGRIGVTGNSGGGTLTTYLNALDDRYTMAAPSCFVTSYRRNIENELPQDTEQNPPGFLDAGLDMADFFIARAPRPTLLLGQKNDFFDQRGVTETYREIRRIYRLLGAGNNIACFIGPDKHGFWQANREAMYGFFCARSGIRAKAAEPELRMEKATDLHCTRSGQVVGDSPSCRRVFHFTARTALSLRKQRSRPDSTAALRALACRMLAITPPRTVPEFRVLRPYTDPARQVVFSRYAVESEPGMVAILSRMDSEARFHLEGKGAARLWVPHMGTRPDWREGRIPDTETDRAWFAVDPRGCGESRPVSCGMEEEFLAPYGSDFLYACCGSMLNTPYIGGAVRDVLAAIRLLQANGFDDIRLEGRGLGALKAAFAGLLAGDRIASVRLVHPLLSYHELTQAPFYRWPFSAFVPGILKEFDLPDVYRALAGRLELVDPWNADMQPWKPAAGRAHARKAGIPAQTLRFSKGKTVST